MRLLKTIESKLELLWQQWINLHGQHLFPIDRIEYRYANNEMPARLLWPLPAGQGYGSSTASSTQVSAPQEILRNELEEMLSSSQISQKLFDEMLGAAPAEQPVPSSADLRHEMEQKLERQEISQDEFNAMFNIEDCAICLNSMEQSDRYSLPCGHAFHEHCIKEVLGKFQTCPLCSAQVNLL